MIEGNNKIKRNDGKIIFSKKFDEASKDLISKLLSFDKKERILSLDQVKEHEWFKQEPKINWALLYL